MESSNLELFNRYVLPEMKFIYRLCFKYSKTKYECKVFFSEVIFYVFKGISTYNPQLHIRPWLYTITQRCIKKLLAKKDKIQVVYIEELKADPVNEETISSNCMGIDNYQQFYSDDILHALNMINAISRKAILLQQAGYSLREIADELYDSKLIKSPSIKSVKYRLGQGKM